MSSKQQSLNFRQMFGPLEGISVQVQSNEDSTILKRYLPVPRLTKESVISQHVVTLSTNNEIFKKLEFQFDMNTPHTKRLPIILEKDF